MTVHFAEIPDLSTGAVRFYTVRLGNDPAYEFEKFDAQEYENPHHYEELQIIYTSIEEMGRRGAKPWYFKHEGPAHALPKVDQLMMEANPGDYGLRLYCNRISEALVVLFNGGIKTKLNPKQCPNVAPHFDRALRIARKLEQAERDGFVRYTEQGIEFDKDFELEI